MPRPRTRSTHTVAKMNAIPNIHLSGDGRARFYKQLHYDVTKDRNMRKMHGMTVSMATPEEIRQIKMLHSRYKHHECGKNKPRHYVSKHVRKMKSGGAKKIRGHCRHNPGMAPPKRRTQPKRKAKKK